MLKKFILNLTYSLKVIRLRFKIKYRKEIKLIIGGSAPGWISIDRNNQHSDLRIHLDENTKLKIFDDNTVDCIYSSHTIEHMPIEAVENLFRESLRILKKGGIIRIVAPDSMKLFNEYIESPDSFGKNYEYAVGTGRTLFTREVYYNKVH